MEESLRISAVAVVTITEALDEDTGDIRVLPSFIPFGQDKVRIIGKSRC
jgi:hypothetical protein